MIADNLCYVQDRMQAAAKRVGRDVSEITLVGVTKQQTVETMVAAYQAGVQHFGENRVEEVVAKIPALLAVVDPDRPPVIHMIGHLQRRKVGQLLPYVQLIHSVDSVKLAERIDRLTDKPVDILLECNVSGEASKTGFSVTNWEDQNNDVLAQFYEQVEAISTLRQIRIKGLMTMAPFVDNADETRPYFRQLQHLLTACSKQFPDQSWQTLSMGMTNDFEIAIEEGATMVRVGRAIFPRHI